MTTIQGNSGEWEMVIGLEVHAQVITESKLFSGAATAFGAEPNTQVSLVDAAMPGMLPVLNAKSVEQAVRTGLGLNAKINLTSVFERKNYFYPDLPQGYQISQYLQPIVGEGTLVLDLPDGGSKEVGIERLHMEQDAGKSLHDQHPSKTYIDLNRSGVTLMEIVSKPDMGSAEEAALYMAKLRSILRYLGTCDGNMEEGSLRCDVNLSVRRPGQPLGTRTETKNVNSIRFVKQAIEYEARRQVAVLEDGGKIVQETRLFDPERGETRSMRSKEEAHDYRYFPDPDLLPLVLDPDWVEALRRDLHREIVGRPDVRPVEREQQVDLRAPAPDPLGPAEMGDRLRVVHARDRARLETPGEDVLGERAAVAHLLPAQADGAQRGVVERQEARRRERAHRRVEPADDRRGGLGGDLLRDDDVQQAREPGLAPAPRRQAADRVVPRDVGVALGQCLERRAQGFVGAGHGPRVVARRLRRRQPFRALSRAATNGGP